MVCVGCRGLRPRGARVCGRVLGSSEGCSGWGREGYRERMRVRNQEGETRGGRVCVERKVWVRGWEGAVRGDRAG